jgi:hypothetical protein
MKFKGETVKNLLLWLKKNPLVTVSLLIGIIESPITFFSGIFLGEGNYLAGVLLYLMSTVLWVVSTIIYWKLLLK